MFFTHRFSDIGRVDNLAVELKPEKFNNIILGENWGGAEMWPKRN